MELRETMGLPEGTPMEIYTDGETIVLKKHQRGCLFCGEVQGVINFRGRHICPSCAKEIGLNA